MAIPAILSHFASLFSSPKLDWHPSDDLKRQAMARLDSDPLPADKQVYNHFADCPDCAYEGLAIYNHRLHRS